MQLPRVFAPPADLDHQVGRFLSVQFPFGQLTKHRFILGQCRVAGKELDEERLLLARLGIFGGKVVPPPVISALGKRSA
ncbi:hypothetical protein SDC9_179613 [bioreactor metagenome]|uniref:Uncharacterized protein n=1 Tax=bioreactor metagenome TaxID=1076179 RepID=A0A645GZD8_9ZZZZ